MRQVSKREGRYHIFNCESKVFEVVNNMWEPIAWFMKNNPDIYVLDSSVAMP
jgi:hypothetical protein